MKAATARRPAPANSSDLSRALAAGKALASLQRFACSMDCNPLDLSVDGGKTLDLVRVLEVMRARGYTVEEPRRPQAQLRHDVTTWLVGIEVSGVRATVAIAIPKEPA